MPQVFPKSINYLARSSIPVVGVLVATVALVGYKWNDSAFVTRAKEVRAQPVPFSHRHHVKGLGLDCRYCHASVEETESAGMPATHTCMTCHSQIWKDAPILEPIRASYRENKPIEWTRVHDLPDFVYFDHSIHINKGVGCESCHGRVDNMPLMWMNQALHMGFCLNCHRQPEKFLREKAFIYEFGDDNKTTKTGAELVAEYHAEPRQDCYRCHR